MVGIVTVLYNSETVLPEFFETLGKQSYQNFVLYVVDNLSPDQSLLVSKKLASQYNFKTVFIENSANYGVAKGNNLGIERAFDDGCDLILLSNNDVALFEDSIEILVTSLDKYSVDMVVPKIYIYGTNKIWGAGGTFNKFNGRTIQYGNEIEDEGQFNVSKPVDYAPTCFMLIKKSVFDDIGLMDEKYFVYYDDTDFIHRALKRNKKLWYISESVILHNESTSTGKLSDFSTRYLSRNLMYFSLKNYRGLYRFYIVSANLLHSFFIAFFKLPRNKWVLTLKSYKEGINLYFNK